MPVSDRVAGCLVTRDRQGHHEQPELFIGELVAVDIGGDQRSDDVLAGMLSLMRSQLHAVEHQFTGRRQRFGLGEFRVLVADHLVGPVEQLRPVLEGHPEQTGDQLQREFAGHLRHEIPSPGVGCICHDSACPLG